MTADTQKPKATPVKVKKKTKRKPELQAKSPFWVQLNTSRKHPKRR